MYAPGYPFTPFIVMLFAGEEQAEMVEEIVQRTRTVGGYVPSVVAVECAEADLYRRYRTKQPHVNKDVCRSAN